MNDLGGPPCTYVGHPLSERLVDLRPNELEKRLRRADPPLVLVLPGSRTGEIRRMAPVFGQAIARVAEQFGPIEAVVPAVPRLADIVRAAIAAWPIPARVTADRRRKARGVPDSAGGPDKIRHVDARTGAGRRPDGRCVQSIADRGTCWPSPHQRSVGDPCQPCARRKRGPGISSTRLHPGPTRYGTPAAAGRHAGSPQQIEAFTRLDAIMVAGKATRANTRHRWSSKPLEAEVGHNRKRQFGAASGSLPRKVPDRRMSLQKTGFQPLTLSPARLNYGRPRLSAAGPAHQRGARADGRYERRLDHRAYRDQGASYSEGRRPWHVAHGGGSRTWPVAKNRNQTRRSRPSDLRDDNAGHAVPVDCKPDLRDGWHPQYRQFRRAGRVLGLSVLAYNRGAIHRQRYGAQGGRGRRRQDVVDHRLYRSCDVRVVRRRCRRGASGAEQRRLRHHGCS